MGVSDQLRQTKKGNLSYERHTSETNLKLLLKSCSSPPQIQVSQNFSKKWLAESEREEKKDVEKDTQLDTYTQQKDTWSSKSSSLVGTDDNPNVRQITSPDYGKSRKAIKEYERAVEAEARKAHEAKQRQFEDTMAQIQREAEENLRRLRQQASQNVMSQIQSIEQKQESQEAEIVKQHQTLKQTHEQRKQIHDARIQEAEAAKLRLQEEELQRKQRENKLRLDMIVKSVADLGNLSTKLQTLHGNCKHKDLLPEAAKNSLQLVNQLSTMATTISTSCQGSGEAGQEKVDKIRKILEQSRNAYEFVKQEIGSGEASQPGLEKVDKIRKILEQSRNAYEFVKQEIDKATQAGAKAEAEAAQKAQAAAAAAAAARTPQPSTSTGAPVATSTPVTQSSGSKLDLATVAGATAGGESLCVDIEAFKHYTVLQNKLKTVEQQIQSLTATPQLKKYKFDIQKAANTPINAISPVSGDHLRDKLQRLLNLLSGNQVEVAGKRITVKDHPDAAAFSKHLTARMIVKKGDEQVSSNHESAFAIGMVAAGLWAEHADFGELLLAQFHSVCPYIVPYYLPKQEGQSNEDYLKARGYKFEDGVCEKQDKFLKRMSGIMRLFSSILVSSPPRGAHPHGIEHAWVWLSRAMNIDPEPDITATMIYDLLQVTGHALCKVYGKQFLKLLHILIKEMLPKLDSVASTGGGGALLRLKSLLETSVKNFGSIPIPEGYLQHGFWNS